MARWVKEVAEATSSRRREAYPPVVKQTSVAPKVWGPRGGWMGRGVPGQSIYAHMKKVEEVTAAPAVCDPRGGRMGQGYSGQRRDASVSVVEQDIAAPPVFALRDGRISQGVSGQRRDASVPVEGQATAAPKVWGQRGGWMGRGNPGQSIHAHMPKVEQRTVVPRVVDTVQRQQVPRVPDNVQRRKRENIPPAAQRSTTVRRPRLKITRNYRPRTYQSILKKAGAPKKHKSVRFAESEQVRTIEWTAEHADESLKHLLDEHALKPVSWTTGSLNTPILRDPTGSHAQMWRTVETDYDVITGFRTTQQRARVCQVQAYYRAQALEALATVTDPDIVVVKQMIPGFYGHKSSRENPLWYGVVIDKYDALEDALPVFAFGEATIGSRGDWVFRSEAFQCHTDSTAQPGFYGRYQCTKGGNCSRFSHARACGCEGKWFRHFGPTNDRKIHSIIYTPSFMKACTATLKQWTAVTQGGDGLVVASYAQPAVTATVFTEPDVAQPHPRPFVTARRQPDYPNSARYEARPRLDYSHDSLYDGTAATAMTKLTNMTGSTDSAEVTSSAQFTDSAEFTTQSGTKPTVGFTTKWGFPSRPNFDKPPSFDPQFLEQVKKQMLEKYPWMAHDSNDKSTWSSIAAARV